MKLRLVAPAKLTLNLAVTGVRDDGYHELCSEMVSLDLADELFLDTTGVGLSVDPASSVPVSCISEGPDNLINRALVTARRSASVRLIKRIPVGGGLGGGSSDAGAILRWAGVFDPLVAVSLGSDVPFCVRGGHALVTGVGDQLSPLPYEQRSFVLLLPPFGADTASVFNQWDQMVSRSDVSECSVEPNAGAGSTPTGNDLEEAALTVEPRLRSWKERFASATGATPNLAGSGSTWFVEGDMAGLGLAGTKFLEMDGSRARLIDVRTTPSGWDGLLSKSRPQPPSVREGSRPTAK